MITGDLIRQTVELLKYLKVRTMTITLKTESELEKLAKEGFKKHLEGEVSKFHFYIKGREVAVYDPLDEQVKFRYNTLIGKDHESWQVTDRYWNEKLRKNLN